MDKRLLRVSHSDGNSETRGVTQSTRAFKTGEGRSGLYLRNRIFRPLKQPLHLFGINLGGGIVLMLHHSPYLVRRCAIQATELLTRPTRISYK